jgi:cell division protein FtsB
MIKDTKYNETKTKRILAFKVMMTTSLFWATILLIFNLVVTLQENQRLTKENNNLRTNVEELTKQYGQGKIIFELKE